MHKEKEKIIIVGAGIGGLVSSLLLSDQGMDVVVIDKNKEVGGKLRSIPSEDGPIDAGPTVLTLIDIFVEIFSQAKLDIFNELDLFKDPYLARHWWPDGTKLDLFCDHNRNLENIESVFGSQSASDFNFFHKDCKKLFNSFDKSLLKNKLPTIFFTKPSFLKNIHNIVRILGKPSTFSQKLSRYFEEPKLKQLFGRYATYVGASPFNSPSILQLIWFAEFSGVWRVKGGLHKLALCIKNIAEDRGVNFVLEEEAEKILTDGKRIKGVALKNGAKLDSNFLIFNGDPRGIAKGNLGNDVSQILSRSSVEPRSLSAYVWSFAAKPKGKNLVHHNVFFNQDYSDEFKKISSGRISEDPTLYVCAQEQSIKNNKNQRYEIIINAPPVSLNKISDKEEYDLCKEITFQKLKKMGLTFHPEPTTKNLTTPANFETLCPGADGSLYGLNPQKMMSTFQRPTTKTKIKGLYLTGGGVHPGPGLPMAALSGKHAAEMIKKDLALT